MKLRIFALFLALMILLPGCNRDPSAGQVIRYDIPGGISNLDPQFATDASARMIINNTFEGLFRQLPSGEVVPCLVQEYQVSPDGLIYTFQLRQDARWNDAKTTTTLDSAREASPVTAHDFVFALSRMFDSTAFSPFATNLLNIRNAELILKGSVPRSALGVKAIDDYTLEISLTHPDGLLPELLSSSYAMPCNQAFFEETRGRYGLDRYSLLANGPFYVRTWNNEKVISIRQNKSYVSAQPVIPAGVDFHIPSRVAAASSGSDQDPKAADPFVRFLAGTTDACKASYDMLSAVDAMGGTVRTFEDTVWVLVLNQKEPALANANIRKAISYTINRDLFIPPYLPENLRPTATLIPPVVAFMGESYREFAGDSSPITYNPTLALEYYRTGLEQLGLTKLNLNEILICKDNSQPLLAGFLQQNFQKQLSLSTGLTALPKEELLERVSAGDFQLAIIPLTAAYSSPDAILSRFKSGAPQNFSGYQNPQFDAFLQESATQDLDSRFATQWQAEQLLLSDCAAIPLYFETTYYAMGKGVSDIQFSPFLSSVYFKDARRE